MGFGAEQEDNKLLERNRQPPGCQNGIQRAVIYMADQGCLDQQAEKGNDQRREYDADKERQAHILRQHHDIGANHEQLAMGHIDHAHHAENNHQAERYQHQYQNIGAGIEEYGNKFTHHINIYTDRYRCSSVSSCFTASISQLSRISPFSMNRT